MLPPEDEDIPRSGVLPGDGVTDIEPRSCDGGSRVTVPGFVVPERHHGAAVIDDIVVHVEPYERERLKDAGVCVGARLFEDTMLQVVHREQERRGVDVHGTITTTPGALLSSAAAFGLGSETLPAHAACVQAKPRSRQGVSVRAAVTVIETI